MALGESSGSGSTRAGDGQSTAGQVEEQAQEKVQEVAGEAREQVGQAAGQARGPGADVVPPDSPQPS